MYFAVFTILTISAKSCNQKVLNKKLMQFFGFHLLRFNKDLISQK
jgi:hypothetical protein